MKETLQQKIEGLLQDAIKRRDQLNENVLLYKNEDNWEGAMKCDIKSKQFDIFIKRLEDALKP